MNYIDESTQKHIDELVKSLNKVRKENHLLTKENKSLKKQLPIHGVVKSLKGKFSDEFLDYVQKNAKERKVESLWWCDGLNFYHINHLHRYWKEKT